MPSDRKKITNLIPGDVVIEDLGVRLRGRGDSSTVPAEAAAASRDLVRNARFVKIETIKVRDPVPFWPFVREKETREVQPQAPAPAPQVPALAEITKYMSGINQALQALLERPSPAPPEVVAAHVRTAQLAVSLPAGLPGAPNLPGTGRGDDPMFIPSKIVPDGASASIKVKQESVVKDDFDDGLEALRKARRK